MRTDIKLFLKQLPIGLSFAIAMGVTSCRVRHGEKISGQIGQILSDHAPNVFDPGAAAGSAALFYAFVLRPLVTGEFSNQEMVRRTNIRAVFCTTAIGYGYEVYQSHDKQKPLDIGDCLAYTIGVLLFLACNRILFPKRKTTVAGFTAK